LIDAYERRHFPVDPTGPIDAIKFCMEQGGMAPNDLESWIGQRNRVYEVLRRQRSPTLANIRRLSVGSGIPVQILIGS